MPTPASPRIVLVGGGDPLLARGPADRRRLPGARRPRRRWPRHRHGAAGPIGRSRVRLGYDASLFTGPQVNPHWRADLRPRRRGLPDHGALGRRGRHAGGYGREADPAARRRRRVRRRRCGGRASRCSGRRSARRAGRAGRRPAVARCAARRCAEIVEQMLEVSDNEGAEVLAHQVGARRAAARRRSPAAPRRSGRCSAGSASTWPAPVYDGSGLSRDDRLARATLVACSRSAASRGAPRAASGRRPACRSRGSRGSLTYRFDERRPGAAWDVRAKTGTLTGVHGLAGTATRRDGAVMVLRRDRRPGQACANTLDARALRRPDRGARWPAAPAAVDPVSASRHDSTHHGRLGPRGPDRRRGSPARARCQPGRGGRRGRRAARRRGPLDRRWSATSPA